MFCVVVANTTTIDVKVYNTHKWLSGCHVAVTEHGFEYPKHRCFCVKEDKRVFQ